MRFRVLVVVVVMVLASAKEVWAATPEYYADWNALWNGETYLRWHRNPVPGWPDWLLENGQRANLEAVKLAVQWELYTGYPGRIGERTLKLTNTITRAEFATALSRTIGEDPGNGSPWYANYLAVLGQKGILDPGKGDWNAPITRAEMAAWMGRAARAMKADIVRVSVSFPDVPADHPDTADILEAARAGVVEGYEDGTFRPNDTAQRVHAALMLVRLARGMNQNKPDPEMLLKMEIEADEQFNRAIDIWNKTGKWDMELASWKATAINTVEAIWDWEQYTNVRGKMGGPQATDYRTEPVELHSTVAKIKTTYWRMSRKADGSLAAWDKGYRATAYQLFVKRNGEWVISDGE